MSNEKLSWIDIEELAAELAGLDPKSDVDYSTIEQALYDKLEMPAEALEVIIKKLFSMLQFGVSPLTSTPYVGFSKDDVWLIKKEIPVGGFISNLIQWITDGEEPDKGFVKPITIKGIRTYDLILVKSEYEVSIKKPKS